MNKDKTNERYIPVEGGNLYCQTVGNATPQAIVIHGGPGLGHQYLLPQMAALGEFTSAIFYDQRGTGNSISNKGWQQNPFQTYINDLDQIRKTYKLETMTLIAHSWGGLLASHYALAHPEQVDKLIYITSVPLSSKDYLSFVRHRSKIVAADNDQLTAIRQSTAFSSGDIKAIEQYYRICFKHYFIHPELVNQLSLKMVPETARDSFKIYDLFYNYISNNPFDLYNQLNDLSKRTLIIAGDRDIIPKRYAEHMHQIIKTSTLDIIKNSGHFPYIDQPDNLFNSIKAFVNNDA